MTKKRSKWHLRQPRLTKKQSESKKLSHHDWSHKRYLETFNLSPFERSAWEDYNCKLFEYGVDDLRWDRFQKHMRVYFLWQEPDEQFTEEEIQLLYDLIANLTPTQKQYVQFFLDGYSEVETAEQLNVSISTIENAWHGIQQSKSKPCPGKIYGGILTKLKNLYQKRLKDE